MSTSYGYDEYARLVRRSFADRVLGDGTERFTYDSTYSNGISNGTLMSMRMVSGGNIVYQYDGLQRLTNKDIAGEVWETFTYSNTQVSSKINYIGDTRVHSLHYLYDGNGNITKETLSEGGVQTSRNYAYDKLNQLTQVKENGVVKETYAYDNAGNITSFNNGSTQNHTLVYGDAQWKDLLTAVDGEAITYDAIGNPLTYHNGSNYSFTWAEGRRLTSATKAEQTTAYTYDYTGLRTKKVNNDGTYTVYHIADGRYVGETLYRADGSRRLYVRYIYDENDSVCGISLWKAGYSSAWEDYYFLKNLQGDVLRVYRASDNSLAASYTYDAWGNIVASQNYHNFDGIAISQLNPFRYRGYYFDNETYFYYLQSRYYDPAIGRFINADGMPITGQGVVGNNMFAYCGNNPVIRNDNGGYYWDTVIDVVSVGFSVIDVINNPDDPWAWVGLAADVASIVVPFFSGGGAIVKAATKADDVVDAAKTTGKLVNKADDLADAGTAINKTTKAARQKAVRNAWKNEVDLVSSTGKGSRAWTDLEMAELLDTGKVKGYVGHHMKSVKGYPELAGDPLNIQFLTRNEHLAAHRGNWRNITHGRYTP